MNDKRNQRIVIAGVLLVLLGAFLYLLRGPLTPVFIALFLAYLFDPVIDRMESWRLNRTVSIFILAALIVVVLGGVLFFLLFQAQRELVELFNNLPGYLSTAQEKLAPLVKEYLGVELPANMEDFLGQLKSQFEELDPANLKPVSAVLTRIFSNTLAFFGWLVGILIIPVFLFYFLRDWDTLKYRILDYVPVPYQSYVKDKAFKVDEALGAFIRGQLTICFFLGVLYTGGLLLVGVDMAVLIGMGSGLLFIVPYLGTIIGVVVATIMGLLEFGIAWQILGVWGVYAVVQAMEGTLITPKIMGDRVGISPVIVIIALLIGAELLGFLGILVAVPAAAVLKVFITDGLERYRESEFFQGEPAGTEQKPENDGSDGGG
ncbi:MAG: AI-2E family transporter [bacterium]